MSARTTWILPVAAYSAILLLAFLNPWLLVALLVGAAVGSLARLLRKRARAGHSDPSIDQPDQQQAPRRRGPRVPAVLAILASFAALSVVVVAGLLLFGDDPSGDVFACAPQHTILYEGSAVADETAGEWAIEDRLAFPPDILAAIRRVVRPLVPDPLMPEMPQVPPLQQLNLELKDLGWTLEGTVDGSRQYARVRTEPLDPPLWPLLTSSEIDVPSVEIRFINPSGFGASPSPGPNRCSGPFIPYSFAPGEGSTLTITAPAHLIVKTFPGSEGEDMLNGNWRWEVPAEARTTDDDVVRIQVASPIVQHEITSRAADLSVSTALWWGIGLVGAAFTTQLKDVLGRPFKRLFRTTPSAKESQTTGPEDKNS